MADNSLPKRDVNPTNFLEFIRDFFEESEFDPYEKERLGPQSYRVAGQPCHGGYPEQLDVPVTLKKEEPKDS